MTRESSHSITTLRETAGSHTVIRSLLSKSISEKNPPARDAGGPVGVTVLGLEGQLGDDRSMVRWPEPGCRLVRGFCIHDIRFDFGRYWSREDDVYTLAMLG